MPKCETLKMALAWATALLCLAAAPRPSEAAFSTSRIAVEPDGGYSGIVIKIQDTVAEGQCADIIKNLKAILTDASRTLYVAMDGKVFFKQVTVVVPRTWTEDKCRTQIRSPMGSSAFVDADITVTGPSPDPVHRRNPFTQQSRGCGQGGDLLNLPSTFLHNLNNTWQEWGDPSKLFVAEWAKLRYGVFDEFGFPDDPLYPNYHKVNGNVVPTGSSNLPVAGAWLDAQGQEGCDPTAGSCLFRPASSGNHEITCSLGYLPFLPNVRRFCSAKEALGGSGGVLAPTKHNVLCQGRSAMEVILAHADFAANGGQRQRVVTDSAEIEPVVKVVREARPQYVLVVEAGAEMNKADLWTWVSKATRKFIRHDLDVGARMALVTFSNVSQVAYPMVELKDDSVRRSVADTIPVKQRVARNPTQRCVICAVQTAMQNVLNDNEAGGHIILVTRGDNETLSITDETTILEHARYYNVKFSSILLPEAPSRPALPFYDSAAQLSGGKSYVFPTSSHVGTSLYAKILEAFQEIRRIDSESPADIPVRVHAKTALREAPAYSTKGSFSIDTTLGRDSLFGVLVNDANENYIESIQFMDNQAQAYGPYTSFSSDFNDINLVTINFPQDTVAPPFDDFAHLGMTWQYEVKWFPRAADSAPEQENVVLVTSKPRNVSSIGLIGLKMWTSSDVASDMVTSQHPLALFVQLTRGQSPVLKARVQVDVIVDLEDGTKVKVTEEPLVLYDKGNGDPDLVSGDGIYSRYLTQYSAGKGRYRFLVSADDNDNQAYSIQLGRNGRAMPVNPTRPGTHICCGSRIEVPEDLQLRTGSFRRSESSPVIHLFSVPDANAADRMPPARIADLRLSVVADAQRLDAEWTAPGDDFDYGSVNGYKFVFSEDITDLLDPKRQPPILASLEQRHEAGTQQNHSFTFRRFDQDYHVAMYGVDEAGNRGNMSNIVLVRMPAPPPSTTDLPVGPEPEDSNWILYAVIAGVIVTLLLCLLCILYVFVFARRGRSRRRQANANANGAKSKSSGVNVDLHHAASDTSSYESDPKNSSSNQLVPQISTISSTYKQQQQRLADANPAGSSSTSFGNGITPTYWSASQLLKEHEERVRRGETLPRDVRSHEHAPPAPIPAPYDDNYNNDPAYRNSYSYYNGAAEIYTGQEGYYVQEQQPAYQADPQRFSTADSSTVGGYDPHGYHPMPENQFNVTLEGSSDADSTLARNNNTKNPNISTSRGAAAVQLQPHNTTSSTMLPRNSGSDHSSSGGVTNPSLQGSLLSLNSGRPASTLSKTRNITQV